LLADFQEEEVVGDDESIVEVHLNHAERPRQLLCCFQLQLTSLLVELKTIAVLNLQAGYNFREYEVIFLVTNLRKGVVSGLVDAGRPFGKLRVASRWIFVILEVRGCIDGFRRTSFLLTYILLGDRDQEGFLESDLFVVLEHHDKINFPLAYMLLTDGHKTYLSSSDVHEDRRRAVIHILERIQLLAAIEKISVFNRNRVLEERDRLCDVCTVNLDIHGQKLFIKELSCRAWVFSDGDCKDSCVEDSEEHIFVIHLFTLSHLKSLSSVFRVIREEEELVWLKRVLGEKVRHRLIIKVETDNGLNICERTSVHADSFQ